jgi:hypothetical protein
MEDSDCARIVFRHGEQEIYFFPVKVQRKIFFPNIFRGRIFFLPLIITAYSNLRLSYSFHISSET